MRKEACFFVVGASSQTRNFRGQGVEKQNLENEEPGGASLSDGGPCPATVRRGLRSHVSGLARPAGPGAGDGRRGPCPGAGGLSDVEGQSRI